MVMRYVIYYDGGEGEGRADAGIGTAAAEYLLGGGRQVPYNRIDKLPEHLRLQRVQRRCVLSVTSLPKYE